MFILCASQRKITKERPDDLVSDSVNVYPVQFKFSTDWRGLTRTACFRTVYNRKVEQKFEILLDETNICNIPWELLVNHGRELEVGVYGTNGDDLILNTIWFPLGTIYEGAKNVDPSTPNEPTPDVYQQILSNIGNMEELETDNKDSLVDAINEVYNKVGSGVGPDGPLPSSFVTSFNGRTGDVVSEDGDYSIDSISGLASELDKIPSATEALTNEELEEILK